MQSDYIDPNHDVKRCMKCLDDSEDEGFWETHQELSGTIWCVRSMT